MEQGWLASHTEAKLSVDAQMNGLCLKEPWWCLSCFLVMNFVSVLTSSQVLVDSFQVTGETAPTSAITVIDSCFAEKVFKG